MISKEEIINLAELARLQLSEGEMETLGKDISNILDYVSQISVTAPDVQKEKPLVHNVMRADEPRKADDMLAGKREVLLNALPKRKDDFAVVRKIIQKDE